jgi:hypothetical protein
MAYLTMIVTPYCRTHKVSRRVRHAISELESLAITPKGLELNDDYEMERLVDNIKLYQDRTNSPLQYSKYLGLERLMYFVRFQVGSNGRIRERTTRGFEALSEWQWW